MVEGSGVADTPSIRTGTSLLTYLGYLLLLGTTSKSVSSDLESKEERERARSGRATGYLEDTLSVYESRPPQPPVLSYLTTRTSTSRSLERKPARDPTLTAAAMINLRCFVVQRLDSALGPLGKYAKHTQVKKR